MHRTASRVAASSWVCLLLACAAPKAVAPPTPAPPSEHAAVQADAAEPDAAKPETPAESAAPIEPVEPAVPPATSETPAPETPPPGFVPIPAKRRGGFPGLAFAEVRAFAFDLRVSAQPNCGMPLDADGTLCETVDRPGVVLSAEQTKILLGMLTSKSTWGEGSSCFLPHHGFVFYDDAGTPVAQISLCFMCQMMVSAPSIPKAKRLGPDTYGLNEKSTERLRGLCRELGLPMCDAKHPSEFPGPR